MDEPGTPNCKPGRRRPPTIGARTPGTGTHTRTVASLRAQIKGSDRELEDRKAEQQRILRDLNLFQQPYRASSGSRTGNGRRSRATTKCRRRITNRLLDKKLARRNVVGHGKASAVGTIYRSRPGPGARKADRSPTGPYYMRSDPWWDWLLRWCWGSGRSCARTWSGEWELPAGTAVLARLPEIQRRGPSGERNRLEPDHSTLLAKLAGRFRLRTEGGTGVSRTFEILNRGELNGMPATRPLVRGASATAAGPSGDP